VEIQRLNWSGKNFWLASSKPDHIATQPQFSTRAPTTLVANSSSLSSMPANPAFATFELCAKSGVSLTISAQSDAGAYSNFS
jgi:hypothetical protein